MKPKPLPIPPEFTGDARSRLAADLGMDPVYLYQLVTGRREMEAAEAVRTEARSGRRLRRWHLRCHSWHEIWPELVGSEGAPSVPEAMAAVEGQPC